MKPLEGVDTADLLAELERRGVVAVGALARKETS